MKPLFVYIQYILPHHLLSRLVGWFISIETPLIKNNLIKWFVRRYQVNMQEAVQEDALAYKNFNDFFTRQLKKELRPIAESNSSIISPVDGTVSECGTINDNRLLQAKKIDYSLEALLANQKDYVAAFKNGEFATIYLSPKDYHCVHMPVSGKLREMIYVPGRIFSVNPATTANVPNLFARNERVVMIFETEVGLMSVIMVGAMIVAGISTAWQGQITPPQKNQILKWQYENVSLNKGDKLGHFSLGSTVIVLFQENKITWDEQLKAEAQLKFGQEIAQV